MKGGLGDVRGSTLLGFAEVRVVAVEVVTQDDPIQFPVVHDPVSFSVLRKHT
jgi:hypothetical protein